MTKQLRAEHTRAAILDAAQTCFAQHGYDATGVAEICRQAGISKGAFYHHFPSKQEVYLELLNAWLAQLDRQMVALQAGGETVPQALRAMSAMLPQVFQVASGQLPIFLDFWAQAARQPHLWQATIAPFQHYRNFLTGLLNTGLEEGSLQDTEPELAAQLLIAIAVGVLLQGLLDPEKADWGQVAQRGIEGYLRSIERNPPA